MPGRNPAGEGTTLTQLSKAVEEMRADHSRVMGAVDLLLSQGQGPSSAAPQSQNHIPSNVVFSSSAGPLAPPAPTRHETASMRTNWRHLVQRTMGGQPPYTYHWPSSMARWPYRTIRGQHGEADRDVPILRLNWNESYMHPDNQKQLRTTFNQMLTHRKENGVPPHMTREQLVSLMANSYHYFRRQYRLRSSSRGRAQVEREKARAQLHARRRTKRKGRMEALGVRHLVRFADGTTVKLPRDRTQLHRRRFEPRADMEFGVQTFVHSPEITEFEPVAVGEERRLVARPLFLEWRSLQLVNLLRVLDENLVRVRPYLLREFREVHVLPNTFKLPSTVRRWMVSSDFMQANPTACKDVSDNAGPFNLDDGDGFAVVGSKLAWGYPIPPTDRPGADPEPDDAGSPSGSDQSLPGEDYFTHRRGALAGLQEEFQMSDEDDSSSSEDSSSATSEDAVGGEGAGYVDGEGLGGVDDF